MTPATLASAGAALFGPRWHSSLADLLGTNRRTVHRWSAGAWPVPDAAAAAIRAALAERRDHIDRMLERS